MSFYEVVYENGASSVLCGEEEEVKAGLSEQQRRANTGEVGGPDGHPAERIKKVLEYDKHPDDFNPRQELSADEAASVLAAVVADKDVVSVPEVIDAFRDAVHPMVDRGPQESKYKMEETGELEWSGE